MTMKPQTTLDSDKKAKPLENADGADLLKDSQDLPEQQLALTLAEMTKWRALKQTPSESIPDDVWRKIFSLEHMYSSSQLRIIFGVTHKQYATKREQLSSTLTTVLPETNTSNENEGIVLRELTSKPELTLVPKGTPVADEPTKLEIDVKNKCAQTQSKSKPPAEPYKTDPLPSAKTLIVEFRRADNQIMRIHTTQDSISTLMKEFFGGAAC